MAKAKVLRKFITAATFIANSAKRQFGWDDTAGAEALLIHQTDDSLKKISEDGLQALLARDPQTFTGANTFQKKVTLDLGTGSEDALLLDVAEPTSAEDRDSHSIVIRSAAYEAGVGETHDWRIKSIVRAVETLQNQLIIEHQQDGGGYSSVITFDESGEVIIPDKLQVGSASTWLRVDPKQTVSGGAGNVSQIFMQSGAGAISTSDDGSTYTNIQAVLFQSPFISKGASDTITTAATVRIQTPPSQGDNNYSLLVDTGESKFGGLLTAGGGILVTGGASVFNEDGDNVDFRIEGGTDANLFFVDGSTDRIGVGTASPGAKLDVVGTGGLRLSDVSTDATEKLGEIIFRHETNSEEDVSLISGFSHALDGSENLVLIGGGRSSLNAATRTSIYAAANPTTLFGTEMVEVDINGAYFKSGDVGIGTASPGAKLDVNGDSIFNSGKGANNFSVHGDTVDNILFVNGSGDNLVIGDTSGEGGFIATIRNPTNNGLAIYSGNGGNISLVVRDGAGNQRFMVKDDGSVDIGTISGGVGFTIDANAGGTDKGYMIMEELTVDAAAPLANHCAIFVRDNGSGKTQICARFNTGAIQVLATEP